uniref:Fork-head domain-containing protein n=1 Tax=Mastacembelus armatus TaxID=205130 RepID=A0A7N8XU18_9TELE
MTPEKGRAGQHLEDTSYMQEEKARYEFISASKTEESSREINLQEMATRADTSSTGIFNKPDHSADKMMGSSHTLFSKDTQPFLKPSLSYTALISKVILSSPLQKLNLASIYRAMEEQFPYLRSRGPGWRNSVRHSLSVNDCFVKVSRCEDGRGHYWGVHQAHVRDFQQGNFGQYRKARGRSKRERSVKVAQCLAWLESSLFLGRLGESRPLGWVEPHCLLQEPRRYQMSSLGCAESHYQPWSVTVGCLQFPTWMRSCYFHESRPGSFGKATAGRENDSQPLTTRLHCWKINDPVVKGMKESYDSRFMTSAGQVRPCWCMSPISKELIKPLPYKTGF